MRANEALAHGAGFGYGGGEGRIAGLQWAGVGEGGQTTWYWM